MEDEINTKDYTELIIKRIENILNSQSTEESKITPYRISKNANMNPRTLNHLLNGFCKDVKISTIHKICTGLDMSVREFFDNDLFN